MEKEQDIIDPEYLKGFNQGYTMAKYLPETSAKIVKSEVKTPHMEGFQQGRDQYLMEVVREKYPEWLKDGHPKYKEPPVSRTKDRGRDMDKS
ncbi:MAG: hypothetical protein ABS46_18695 [Cytophagaceae bacterium SCN 52-12]|nr:MAG: hypothetical protein ABS46_18695 [Cytophagaceae bacterium SCN 52-12]